MAGVKMPLRVLSPQQKRRTLEISSLSRIWRRKYCDVAQLVEHLTLTQKVVGSKPAITTMESKRRDGAFTILVSKPIFSAEIYYL